MATKGRPGYRAPLHTSLQGPLLFPTWLLREGLVIGHHSTPHCRGLYSTHGHASPLTAGGTTGDSAALGVSPPSHSWWHNRWFSSSGGLTTLSQLVVQQVVQQLWGSHHPLTAGGTTGGSAALGVSPPSHSWWYNRWFSSSGGLTTLSQLVVQQVVQQLWGSHHPLTAGGTTGGSAALGVTPPSHSWWYNRWFSSSGGLTTLSQLVVQQVVQQLWGSHHPPPCRPPTYPSVPVTSHMGWAADQEPLAPMPSPPWPVPGIASQDFRPLSPCRSSSLMSVQASETAELDSQGWLSWNLSPDHADRPLPLLGSP